MCLFQNFVVSPLVVTPFTTVIDLISYLELYAVDTMKIFKYDNLGLIVECTIC